MIFHYDGGIHITICTSAMYNFLYNSFFSQHELVVVCNELMVGDTGTPLAHLRVSIINCYTWVLSEQKLLNKPVPCC